jgi:hypothetical protein
VRGPQSECISVTKNLRNWPTHQAAEFSQSPFFMRSSLPAE